MKRQEQPPAAHVMPLPVTHHDLPWRHCNSYMDNKKRKRANAAKFKEALSFVRAGVPIRTWKYKIRKTERSDIPETVLEAVLTTEKSVHHFFKGKGTPKRRYQREIARQRKNTKLCF